MNDDESGELLSAVKEMRDLLRLMAEPAIAERDKNLRAELRKIVGNGAAKAASVLLMDGSRLQAAIRAESGMNQGNLSTLVKRLDDSKLLLGDVKQPKLAISIPANFFENGTEDE